MFLPPTSSPSNPSIPLLSNMVLVKVKYICGRATPRHAPTNTPNPVTTHFLGLLSLYFYSWVFRSSLAFFICSKFSESTNRLFIFFDVLLNFPAIVFFKANFSLSLILSFSFSYFLSPKSIIVFSSSIYNGFSAESWFALPPRSIGEILIGPPISTLNST